jgi:excisionase family DNA binding protein
LGAVLVVHTMEEAAAILRVKKSWLERQAAARTIPFTMLGGAYRFTSAHLAAIVQIHENPPVTAARGSETTNRPPRPRQHPASQTPTLLKPKPRTGPRRVA